MHTTRIPIYMNHIASGTKRRLHQPLSDAHHYADQVPAWNLQDEFEETHSRLTQKQPTHPLPIKSSDKAFKEMNGGITPSSAMAKQYDWMTWRMYHRITSARRMKTVAPIADESLYSNNVIPPIPPFHQSQFFRGIPSHLETEENEIWEGVPEAHEDEGIFTLDME